MKSIGPYKILETVRGGRRPIHKVEAKDGKVLAVKTLATEDLSMDERLRFQQEAQVASGLDHPNLLKVLDFGESEGFLYQAMDILEGADLAAIPANQRGLDWTQKLSIMKQATDGMAYVHERGMVHRHLRPGNVFVENSGRVRILDLGAVYTLSPKLAQAGVTLDTMSSMAPEQALGEESTPATDVFALGVVYYELVTGGHPFAQKDDEDAKILNNILFNIPTPVKELAPDTPSWLDIVLGKALAKKAVDRLKDAGQLRELMAAAEKGKLTEVAKLAAPTVSRPSFDQTTVRTTKIYRSEIPAVIKATPKVVAAKPAPERPREDLAYCPSCGAGNHPRAVICIQCGGRLVRTVVAQSGRSTPRWWIAAGAAVVILALVMFLLLRR